MGMVFGKISEEQPEFEVLRKFDGNMAYEVRQYHDQVRVETSARNTDESFKRLARYIGVFGTPENRAPSGEEPTKIAMTAPVTMEDKGSPAKIAMTAPVTMSEESGDEKSVLMSFILPSKYKKVEDTPVPTDSRVHLEQVPGGVFAVTQFSGYYRYPKEVKSIADDFAKQLAKDGIKVEQGSSKDTELEYELRAFNPPITPSFLRTNEIAIKVVTPSATSESE